MGDQLAGRYRLEQRLGKGGFGEVWRAHDTALDRAVAVKVLLETAMAEEAVARFRREATIGARLQHPGITVVHDVGQEEGQLFIVMELLAGEDLRTTLSRVPGGLPVPQALELAAQAAEALAAAHERSVIHRDLKPANLFLLPAGRLKICDFGIAHSSDATAGWTVTGRIFGSPPYMAPEQWRGERVDARCDLYALGCVLYALLSGEPPFGEAEVPYVLMRRHIEDPPIPLREAGAPVPPEVERLVRQLLEKAPADRPESAEVVAAQLRALLAGPLAGPLAVPLAGGGTREGAAGRGGTGGAGTGAAGIPAAGDGSGVGSGAAGGYAPGGGYEAGGVFGPASGDGAGTVPGGGPGGGTVPGGVPGGVRDFVRDLLLEAEDELHALPPGHEARIEVLAAAAGAAARFDAGLAGRLLRDAEVAAWHGGGGDGARTARLLTGLARDTSAHAPARARRLLTDAQQALFTVFGSNRAGPLRAVAEELAKVAPEQAAGIAAHHFADSPADNRLRARIETAARAADPAEAELQLALIQDAGLRGAATYDMVLAVAPHDLPAAMRLSERIGSAGGRLLALCQVARDLAGAGDAAGGARALEQAEEELPRFLEERAAWLREESGHQAEQGRFAAAERLRNQAAGLLRGRPQEAADEKADHALSSLSSARTRVERGALPPLAPAAARERASRARDLSDPVERARELARIARECVAADRTPWTAEAAADAGSPPPPGTAVLGGPEPAVRTGTGVPAGARAWYTDARPDALYAAGAHVVWRSGPEVGCVRAGTGTTRWTACADEGAAAPPLPGAGRVLVSCAADAATVYVEVRRDGEPGARLLAREPRDGRVRWWQDVPESGPMRSAGPLLVHGAPGDLTVLRAATGEVLWRHALPVPGMRVASAVGDCLLLADGMRLQALDLPTGRELWREDSEAMYAVHIPRPTGRGGIVHLHLGTHLLALEQESGRLMWQVPVGLATERLLIEGGTVYVAAHHEGWDQVLALDERTGAMRWWREVARCGGEECGLELLGLRPGGLYVQVPHGNRRGLLARSAEPFVAVLDPSSGKPRRRWNHPPLAAADTVLIGDHLVLSRPDLTAYALP
ncbi:protein kinase [Streptomyces sp. NPDC056773]|uniref:protein kinase domain-containing protein n=1 Tax=Streptomyces sp. NPDC056773 TaxID=3345941 RepID=UPI0036AD3B8F